MTVDFQHLLDMQNALQTKSYGAAPADLSDDDKVVFIKDMILAATDELHEMLTEVPAWKPWVNREKLQAEGRGLFDREAYIGEWIDLLHFVMNLALVMDLDAADIAARYERKHTKNARRQELGYDGVTEKCAECKRALDDDAVKCVKTEGAKGVQYWCERTGAWTSPVPV